LLQATTAVFQRLCNLAQAPRRQKRRAGVVTWVPRPTSTTASRSTTGWAASVSRPSPDDCRDCCTSRRSRWRRTVAPTVSTYRVRAGPAEGTMRVSSGVGTLSPWGEEAGMAGGGRL
jgi:hypothetical protein